MGLSAFELLFTIVGLGTLVVIVGYVQLEKDDKEGKRNFKALFFFLLMIYVIVGIMS